VKGRVVKLPGAELDLDEVAEYIQRGGPSAAVRFLRSAEQTFSLLARSPSIGVRFDPDTPALTELRCFPVDKFRNYLVFYRPSDDGIEVVRVLHGARDIRRNLIGDPDIVDEEEA